MVIMWVWWVCDLILGGDHGGGGGDSGFIWPLCFRGGSL